MDCSEDFQLCCGGNKHFIYNKTLCEYEFIYFIYLQRRPAVWSIYACVRIYAGETKRAR